MVTVAVRVHYLEVALEVVVISVNEIHLGTRSHPVTDYLRVITVGNLHIVVAMVAAVLLTIADAVVVAVVVEIEVVLLLIRSVSVVVVVDTATHLIVCAFSSIRLVKIMVVVDNIHMSEVGNKHMVGSMVDVVIVTVISFLVVVVAVASMAILGFLI